MPFAKSMSRFAALFFRRAGEEELVRLPKEGPSIGERLERRRRRPFSLAQPCAVDPVEGGFQLYRQLILGDTKEVLLPVTLDAQRRSGRSDSASASALKASGDGDQVDIGGSSIDGVVYADSIADLFRNSWSATRNVQQLDAILIVQLFSSAPKDEIQRSTSEVLTTVPARELLKEKGVSLVCLAVSCSDDLADWLSTPVSFNRHDRNSPLHVVGWHNHFLKKKVQMDFAFRFCYHVIKLFILRYQQPQIAYANSINAFEHKMELESHMYTFGLENDGEPCMFPPSRLSRRHVEWDNAMYLAQSMS